MEYDTDTDTDRLVALDGATGRTLDTLYPFPPGPRFDTGPDSIPRPAYDDQRFASDPAGRHLLWVVTRSSSALPHAPTQGSFGELSLFTVGQNGPPTALTTGIFQAAWVPAR